MEHDGLRLEMEQIRSHIPLMALPGRLQQTLLQRVLVSRGMEQNGLRLVREQLAFLIPPMA